MSGAGIDFLTRKAVAEWAYAVSSESVGTAKHAERVKLAGRMITSIAPTTPAQDDAVAHVVFLVRTFAVGGDDATPAAVVTTVSLVMDALVSLGVWTT